MLGSACSDDADDADEGTKLPIEEFVLHECQSSAKGALLTGREASDYAGLECVAWDLRSDAALDLINRAAACATGFGEETLWTPAVKQLSPDRIEYDVQWNFSDPNACGGCLYDFSVKLRDVELGEHVRIDVATRSCTKGCDWSRDSVRTGDEASGIRCRYIENETGDSSDWGKVGIHPRNDGSCDSELIPVEGEDGETRCLPSCEEDSDCPATDVQSCIDGACQLRDPW